MPGIYLGSNPVSMGPSVKEVYVGATKVWPLGGAPLIKYCSAKLLYSQMRISNTTIYYASDPAITVSSPWGAGYATVNWQGTYQNTVAFQAGAFGLSGTAAYVGVPSYIPNTSVTGTSTKISTASSSGLVNGEAMVKQLLPLGVGGDFQESYCRVDSAGNVLFATDDGWSCSYDGNGLYIFNAPRALLAELVFCTIEAPTGTNRCQVKNINVAAGTFIVQVATTSNTASQSGMSIQAILADL